MTTYAGESAGRRDHVVAIVRFRSATVECKCGWTAIADVDVPANGNYEAHAGRIARAGSPEAVKRMFAQHRAALGLRSRDGTSDLGGATDGPLFSMPGWHGRMR